MRLLRAALLAPLLFLTPTSGCVFGCTLIGGWDGLHLEVNGDLPLDRYTVVMRADGHELRSTFEITAEGTLCEGTCEPSVDLGGGRTMVAQVVIGAIGGRIGVRIPREGGPAYVEVDLLRGEVTVASAVYEPEYRTVYPNGRGCDPRLIQATGTFDIPPLEPL
jgi:hypothetical protein